MGLESNVLQFRIFYFNSLPRHYGVVGCADEGDSRRCGNCECRKPPDFLARAAPNGWQRGELPRTGYWRTSSAAESVAVIHFAEVWLGRRGLSGWSNTLTLIDVGAEANACAFNTCLESNDSARGVRSYDSPATLPAVSCLQGPVLVTATTNAAAAGSDAHNVSRASTRPGSATTFPA